MRFRIKPNAVRYRDSKGNWVRVNPGSPLYSTALMVATHRWEDSGDHTKLGKWVKCDVSLDEPSDGEMAERDDLDALQDYVE